MRINKWCGSAPDDYRHSLEADWVREGRGKPKWGARCIVLGDLSPAATFIAANYNLPFDVGAFVDAGRRILNEVEREIGWMYETLHSDGKTKGRIEYTVWSEIFSCPNCAGELVFLEEALDPKTKRVKKTFSCPHCGVVLTKKKMDRLYITRHDKALNSTVRTLKRKPALIVYKVGKTRYEKKPDQIDMDILARIDSLDWPSKVPVDPLPYMHMTHERARMDNVGITHVHHFFLHRTAHVLSEYLCKVEKLSDPRIRNGLLILAQHQFVNATIMNRYRPASSFGNAPLGGVYYISSLIAEASVFLLISGSLRRIQRMAKAGWERLSKISTGVLISTSNVNYSSISPNTIDYIFTDPPFGENIYYADLNFLVESWHGVLTNAEPEAIVDKAKRKGLSEYQYLMQQCFSEYYRILKPGRWMTVVFHNSHNVVWIAIQEALLAAGFVIASVGVMDKQQGSYRQVTSSAMKEDLVVSAYKPNGGLEKRFELKGGSEEGLWDFVQTHLNQVNIVPPTRGRAEVIVERQEHRIYDLMVAFHVQRGVQVPLSAAEFRQKLYERDSIFVERDGMWFLRDQVLTYDQWRTKNQDVGQFEITPQDEASVILWLRQELRHRPRSLSELTPVFLRLSKWVRHEKPIELSEILKFNFLYYDGKGPVPSQIHSYLSSNYKDLRKLEKNDPLLQDRAKDRWYAPDPNKEEDLEKMREPILLKEFEEYLDPQKKRFKVVRMESIRAGFRKAFKEKDYKTIIDVGNKLPEYILHGDQQLLMWYDVATTRN